MLRNTTVFTMMRGSGFSGLVINIREWSRAGIPKPAIDFLLKQPIIAASIRPSLVFKVGWREAASCLGVPLASNVYGRILYVRLTHSVLCTGRRGK